MSLLRRACLCSKNRAPEASFSFLSDKENQLLYEEYFYLTNIEKDFLPVFKRFYSDKKLRTCPVSGEVMEVDDRYL